MTRDTRLEPLAQTDLTLAPGEPDLRGASVFDSTGEELGRVDSLYVDGEERKIRFLLVKSGGILGFGATNRLVPVDAIEHRDVGTVRLSRDNARISGAPGYDPALVEDQRYWEDVYGWFGYPPYWTVGPAAFAGIYPYPAPAQGVSSREQPPADRV